MKERNIYSLPIEASYKPPVMKFDSRSDQIEKQYYTCAQLSDYYKVPYVKSCFRVA